MKRALALIAGTIVAASLAACSSGQAGRPIAEPGGTAASPAGSGSTVPTGTARSGSETSSAAEVTGSDTASTVTAPHSDTASTVTAPTSGEAAPGPQDVTLASMLAMVPAPSAGAAHGDGAVTINLYWKAAAAGGLAVPDDDADAETQAAYGQDLTIDLDAGIGVAGSDLYTQLATPVSSGEHPFALSDVAADVQTGQPPTIAIAARGRFDTSAIDSAFRDNPAWKGELTTPSYHGHTFYRWLDDLKIDMTKINTGLFTTLGNSRRMAFPDPSTFLYGRDDATMHALLDAADDPGSASLAADDDHLAVANALDEKDVYSAMLVGPQPLGPLLDSSDLTPKQAAKALAELREHALQPYLLAGIGETLVDGSPRTVIVLANADTDAARANATALRELITDGTSLHSQRPWSDLFGIDSITTDGTLTIGVLDPTRVTTWYQAVVQRDTLLASDG